ncbi:hypothetical protein OG223_44935 [Streptomyces sp. NBC_01478]|uniref:hypothetical protein n=1 Tax=Streptomyces sp. NBC_01478 TaxID=2903882 RepID=UPI002E34DD90|nr:hypothetical protein [Streptomyces sp. NBC_01478]
MRPWPRVPTSDGDGPEPRVARVDRLLRGGHDEFAAVPTAWASSLLPQLMHLASQQLPELGAARAADMVVDTFLRGLGGR